MQEKTERAMLRIRHWAMEIASRVQGAMGLSWKKGLWSVHCNAECNARMSFGASSRSGGSKGQGSISRYSHTNRKAKQIGPREAGPGLRRIQK